MPRLDASELARRLGLHAEAACRHYLSNGRRQGNYWLVGDARNAPGRSMFVRLRASPKGPPGHWTDAATGEHGDMLDIVREALGLVDFKDVAEEARRFLSLPHPEPDTVTRAGKPGRRASGSPEAARRLVGISQPIRGTLAQTYLRGRGITDLSGITSLRFHPRCYYRPDEHSPRKTLPALIAAVTDLDGRLTGAHRTWLAPDGSGKADVDTPRRAMGDLLGHGIRFGMADDVLAAGEGIETVLSPRMVLPGMPMIAATSAAHLAAILFPATLRRLYVLRDRDPAGDGARDSLVERAASAGIEAVVLSPRLEDFNEDLRHHGPDALLWSTVNLFHRAVQRIERTLDDNEQSQRRLQREQDGTEIKAVELERLTAEGQTMIERRDAFELMRDQAAEHYEHHTGSSWRPRSGSMVNHLNLTSALVDSRDFMAARRRADAEVLIPAGPRIAVSGANTFNDHNLIWSVLDKVHAKYPQMVLLHGGARTGTDLIAAKWAANRKVPTIPFPPDFAKYPAKQAPFKRNDTVLETLPIGVIVFPGGGIQGNLADKARKLGINVYDFRDRGGA